MRIWGRRVVAIAVVLASTGAGACAPASTGPSRPLALEQVLPVRAMEVAPVRAAALDFVRAYAAASSGRVDALARLVGGRELNRWVRWLGVQNGQFAGTIVGTPTIERVTFVEIAPGETYDVARVALRGRVTFRYRPIDADPFTVERVLDGPMLLARIGEEDWRVVDVTRDGVAMSEGVVDLAAERITEGDLAIVVDSAFLFPAGWQVNVTVENRTGGPIRLEAATIEVDGERRDGSATPPLRAIPAATGAVGILAFHAGTATDGAIVELRYATSGGTVTLRVPLGDLVATASGTSA